VREPSQQSEYPYLQAPPLSTAGVSLRDLTPRPRDFGSSCCSSAKAG
jgi:hypothetical protein